MRWWRLRRSRWIERGAGGLREKGESGLVGGTTGGEHMVWFVYKRMRS